MESPSQTIVPDCRKPVHSASGQFWKQIVQNSLDITTVLNERGEIVYGSPATKELLGHEPDDLVGKSAFEFIHLDDVPATFGAFQQVMAKPGQTASAEFRFRHTDGSWRHLASVARNLLHESEVAGIIVNSRDVTNQKLAETALRESEERFRQLTENIDEVFWISDPSVSTMYYVSPAYEKIWGRTCESLLKSPTIFFGSHPSG